MEDSVDADEPIARFIRSHSHMRLELRRPKYSAYMPRLPEGDISVCRTEGIGATEVRAIGDQHVATPTNLIKGYCVQSADGFFKEGLDIEAAPHPHPRHANVRGWTTDPRNRIIAKKLADQAELTVY